MERKRIDSYEYIMNSDEVSLIYDAVSLAIELYGEECPKPAPYELTKGALQELQDKLRKMEEPSEK